MSAPDPGLRTRRNSAPAGRRAPWSPFLIPLLVYLSTAGGSLGTSDAVVTFELTRSLVERGSIALSPDLAALKARGVDGRDYSMFGLGQSLYNIPFFAAGRLVERTAGVRIGRSDTVTKAIVALGSAIAAAVCAAFAFQFAWRVTGSLGAAAYAWAALAFGTLLWPYAKFGFNMPLAAALLLAATYAAWAGVRLDRSPSIVWAGLLLGGAWLTRHELALAALPILYFLVSESAGDRRLAASRIARFLPGVLAAAAIWLAYNQVRFGSPVDAGYAPALSGEGFYGLLLSPGASIFLYSPIAALGAAGLVAHRARDRGTARLFAGLVLVLFAFYGLLEDWPGGRSYGSRYLVTVLPFLCVALAWLWVAARRRSTRRLLVLVLIASAIVQLPGVLVDFSKISEAFARDAAADMLRTRQYVWSSSGFALNLRAVRERAVSNAKHLLGLEARPAIAAPAAEGGETLSQRLAFSLDFWWLYLFYLGVLSAPAAVAAGLAPLAAAAALGWHLTRRRLRRCSPANESARP